MKTFFSAQDFLFLTMLAWIYAEIFLKLETAVRVSFVYTAISYSGTPWPHSCGYLEIKKEKGRMPMLSYDPDRMVFGPTPSRRLGYILGIRNVSSRVCSYSCVYCQVGRMTERASERHAFYEPQDIVRAVTTACEAAEQKGLPIDYLTFVPDGEPTRDSNLGCEIELLKPVGKKIAVITNASLLWCPEVREDLMQADWVSVKVDTVQEAVWRRLNRPDRSLQLATILDGMREFATYYPGELVTETMVVEGMNDSESELLPVAQFLAELQPFIAYLALPTRPPAEHWVQAPQADILTRTYHLFSTYIRNVEFLIGKEGNRFTFSGEVEKDLLSVVNMGPMREDAVREFLAQAQADWSIIPGLIQQGKLAETEYEGETFYLPRVP